MNRKERRKELTPTRIHAKFINTEKEQLPVKYVTEKDGREIAIITVEGYASTKIKDGSGDIVKPEGIDLSRFEAGNAPLKAMHGRGVVSNIGTIKSAKADSYGLYITAEAKLDISKDKQGRPINEHDYVLYDRLMKRIINGFSVGFHNIKEGWDEDAKANIIHSMTLHEVSLVDVPDNPLTIVKMREIYKTHLSSDSSMKKTLADFIVKSLEASSVKIGEMYRIKKEYGSGDRSWDYIANSELVKMSTTENGGSVENPMLYFLTCEPTTQVIKGLLNDVEVVEITAEQLKELQEAETKDLETEDEEDEDTEEGDEEETTDDDTPEQKEEDTKELDTDSQEEEVAGNGDSEDQPENGEVVATEGEKILGEKDAEIAETKQLLDQSIEQSKQLVAENEKLFGIAEKLAEKNKQLKEQLKTYKQLKVKHGLTVNKQQESKDPLEKLVKGLRK